MNDEWTPTVVDDPAPPEPDAAVLARVVGRGRQRLVRRRAIFGSSAFAVAVVIVGSGIAIANNEAHRSRVHIETPTPRIRTEQHGRVVTMNPALGDRWLALAVLSGDNAANGIYLVR